MNNKLLSKIGVQGNKLVSVAQKLGELTAATVSEVAEVQLASVKTYSEMGAGQVKLVSKVRDLETLKTCVVNYNELCRSVGEKVLVDTQVLLRKGMEYSAEVRNISTESSAGMSSAAA